MKSNLISILVASSLILGSSMPVLANEINDTTENILSIEEQEKVFLDIENKLKTRSMMVVPDNKSGKIKDESYSASSQNSRGTSGTYPTRRGTYLVTDGFRTDSLVGHAGMVLDSGTTVESMPPGGVKYYRDNCTTRYTKVWGTGAYSTSGAEDSSAGDWASLKQGLTYNYVLIDIENTSKFYCSQLIYKALKEKGGVNLNYDGGIIYPADLINDADASVYYVYTK